jgi:hypothetical protein
MLSLARIRIRARATAIATCALLAAGMIVAAGAHAETYFFDSTLSLAGACGVSTFDPVEDPGCPGGQHPPSGAFSRPGYVALDAYGDRYVSNYGDFAGEGGRIDIFDSSGHFITEIAEPETTGTSGVAVDLNGVLYVVEHTESSPYIQRISRFVPTTYKPQSGEITYGQRELVSEGNIGHSNALALDPSTGRFFVNHGGSGIFEFGSYAEGNPLLKSGIGLAEMNGVGGSIAVDAAHGKLYVATFATQQLGNPVVRVFELGATHQLLATYDGSNTPTGKFLSGELKLGLAADEENGHLFVGDLEPTKKRIYELDGAGELVGTTEEKLLVPDKDARLAFDNGPNSPTRGYLFAPGQTRSLVFEPKQAPKPPLVESLSVTGVTEAEAVLHARVSPKGQETTYRFEYTTQQSFEEEGFAGASLAKEGTLAPGAQATSVSANLAGLAPGGAYRFRVSAHSEAGDAEAQAAFATYAPPGQPGGCPNEALRAGASAALPDCRAYELVTPADTGGRSPLALTHNGVYFPSQEASPAGDKVPFMIQGGLIPGFEGTGSVNGDPYLATRTEAGWSTAGIGPNGTEATSAAPGSTSPDQGYSFWNAEEGGSAVIGGEETTYVRYPDGHSELIGRGSIATDPRVVGGLISEGGGHIIFASLNDLHTGHKAVQIEPNAPPEGTQAIYDRTADEVTHVVSLLPGEVTPGAGDPAKYLGASLDGREVAFTVGGGGTQIYLRVDNTETLLAAPNGAKFASIAEGGQRLFYFQGGNLFAFDVKTETAIPFTQSGDVTPVNVSADGASAYFVSPSVLTGEEENPNEAKAVEGAENLYRSQEGQISFIATVTKGDVEGEAHSSGVPTNGLGLWVQGAEASQPDIDPSRSTADGGVLLFESAAKLGDYDPEGKAEIYRYDAVEGSLDCLSCNPTGSPASGDASLQSIGQITGDPEALGPNNLLGNLRADGRRVFFESPDQLVLADTDGLQDVYEWEAQGVGSCETPGGCVYLISSGQSAHPNYLYAISANGDNVFFRTSDLLLPATDPDETPSIYDARVEGGFPAPPAPAGECLGEACQPATKAPNDPTPSSSSFAGAGNVPKEAKGRCAKGKHAVRKGKKSRCVAAHKHKTQKKASNKGRTKR